MLPILQRKKRRDYKAGLWKLYVNKIDNLHEPGKVLERHKSMKLTQEEKKIWIHLQVNQKTPQGRPVPKGFVDELYPNFKVELI